MTGAASTQLEEPMRKSIIALAILVFFVVGMIPAMAATTAPANKAPAKKAAQKKVVSAVCPVMGTKIPDVTKVKGGKSVYKGKTYYFCSQGCKKSFDKDPEKYLKDRPMGHMMK